MTTDNVTDIRTGRIAKDEYGSGFVYDQERDNREFADAMRRATERFEEAS